MAKCEKCGRTLTHENAADRSDGLIVQVESLCDECGRIESGVS